MKKQILLLLLMVICCKSYCQIKNTDVLAISPSKMLVVYAALQNPITIAVAGLPAEKVMVAADSGTLTGEKGKYLLTLPASNSLKEVKLTIYEIIKPGKQKEIGTRIYRVKRVPRPLVALSNDNNCYPKTFFGGEINLKDIRNMDQVTISMQDFAFKGLDYTVVKYKLMLVPKDTLIGASAFEGTGSKLSHEMKSALVYTKDNDIIMVYDIYCSISGSSEIRLPTSISLTVKK